MYLKTNFFIRLLSYCNFFENNRLKIYWSTVYLSLKYLQSNFPCPRFEWQEKYISIKPWGNLTTNREKVTIKPWENFN